MRNLWAIIALVFLAHPVLAQQQSPIGPPQVLIVDSDRLYFETQYGLRLARDLAARQAAVQQENDQIVATLTEEERSLTERRPEMSPEAFRAEADAFDLKVQEVRRARDNKTDELQAESLAARAEFEGRVQGIVANIMLERGALLVLEQRNVILSVRSANITDDVIARVDAALGDGTR